MTADIQIAAQEALDFLEEAIDSGLINEAWGPTFKRAQNIRRELHEALEAQRQAESE